ncbi:transcription factor TFIIIB component B'' homolog isoform X6 [Rissa tridactyla]|uniref:transcription factor TFIIIB component B'' homolog isoform X6 n=1 Tax=Rissa tridactyla TaxID=75485 RepID=UPI0023BA6C25|nr:transcription factor TFIIIB component B'' homolog isoform X6 [Rissa tridactyla]
MFRRARLNVRPNVRPGGRAGGAADPEPQGSGSPAAAGAEAAAAVESPRSESDDKTDSSNDAGEASKPAEMPTQRRKRISTMPNLVKPRAGPSSAQHCVSKPQRRASQAPDGSASLQKDSSPSEKSNVESSLKSPMLPEKKTPVPQVPQFSPLKKSVNKEQTVGVAAQKNDDTLQKNVPSPLKERPTQGRSGTQEEKLPKKPAPIKEKRTCSDRERILKARKLREMLKEELKKERMLKHRPPIIEGRSPPDRSKMTMRDLIYYLPENNPMKSSLAEEKRTEKNSALGQMKEQEEKSSPDPEEEDEEEEAENGEESQDGPLLVPRVKVAEDGSIILDEESLTVEVLRTKGPCVVEENDPIFERGSTTTYSSFRKSFYTKPWSNKETDMFFLAISMVGTDFSLIGRLFPHRARAEIKNKFKREEKANGWRIDKAFKEKRPFDFEFFAQLLEKVLADEEKRKQKTVKSQKPKEKKPSRPRKKPKAKAASTEAANDQDDLQEARISDAEMEADTVMAEKENEESLGISDQAEEQVALEPGLAKKKRKKKRKDDLEQEVENLSEEMSVPSDVVEEDKSSKKTEKKMVCDANDGHTTCREELDSVIEGKQDEAAVTEEEISASCLSADDIMEGESDVNLCSFEGSNDVILETESAKLRTLDIRDDTSQESLISELPVSKIRSKERQSEETRETKKKDIHDLHRPDEKQSATESDSQSESMKTEKPADRGCLQRPKPHLVRSSGRREIATQEKMEAETSPNLVNTDDKCSEEDSIRNRNEGMEVENTGLDTKSEEHEKTVTAKAIVRGCRQRFKPNVTRASGRKEEPGKDAGNDKMSHPQPKSETEKNTDQSYRTNATSEEAAEKDDKVLETVSQSNETAGLQKDVKQSVLKPTPLKRGRVQRPKPNLIRSVARQKDLTDEKDPEEEKTEVGEVEKGVIQDENNYPCLKNDVMVHEGTQPCNVMLEGGVSTDSEMNSIHTRECSQEKSSEAESYESEKGSSDVLKQVSDFNTGESGPQKEEEKTVVSSARLLRGRFQRPKPNLRMTTSRKEVLDVNNRDVSQKDTKKEESLTQCDSDCSILPDTDKAGKYEVLKPLESLGEKSFGSQEVSERPKSPKTFSGSEDGELKFCQPEMNQDDTSTTNAGIDSKNTTEEGSKQTPLQPVQLVRSRFQRFKPNLGRAVGKKELQVSENERDKKPEAEQLVLQKDESANTATDENEAMLCQADVSSKEEQEQQEAPQLPCISENILCEQSSAEKSTSQEGKLRALKPGQFIMNGSPRTRPNVERAHSEKESPAAQKIAAPVQEEAHKRENLPVAEESEEPLSSKDDMEVLLFVGDLAKNDNLDINPKSMKSETLSSSKKSRNCHSKGEQEECLSTDAIGSTQGTTESRRSSCNDVQCPRSLVEGMLFMSNDKLSSGEESKQSGTKPLHQARESLWRARPNLVRVTRKRDYPEEGENREEDSAESRNAEVCLVLEKTGVLMQNSNNIVEATSFSDETRKHNFTDPVEEPSCKRIGHDSRLQSPEISSESESQVEQEDDSQLSTSQDKNSDNVTRKQSRRSSKRIALAKHVSELRTAASSASECEADGSEKGSQRQEVKPSATRGKSLKTTHRKKSGKEHRSSKITLVTLRASQEEEEEEEETDDFEPDDEDECFAPEEVNKAPVFVPIGLRSPKPVPVQIEETMEELEISVNIPDVQVVTDVESLSHASVQPVVLEEERVSTLTAETAIRESPEGDKGINDGSTEAAMTLLAMGDPMFQLKTSTEEWTHTLPAQDELDMGSSLVTHAYSKQNRTPSQYLLSSDTSTKELVPSEDGSNINVEDQSTDTRICVKEYFEKNATDTSDSSLPTVNSMRLIRGRLLKPEPDFGVLKSNENIIQKSLHTNVPVEQLKHVQTEATTLRGTAEMQKVELEEFRPAAGDSSVLHDFATGSMEFIKQVDETERTEKKNPCGNSEDLRQVTASPQPEKSHFGLQDYPNQRSVDGLPEQNACLPEKNVCTINFTQKEACAQDSRQQCVSSTEETSVVNNDHRCPEEEQTFILTLVEIPADSKDFDASLLLEQTSEPLLPAPILISPINTSETSVTEVESSMEIKQIESASLEPIPNLQTTQKRSAAELEENDFPPAKKTLSAVAVEGNLETTYKGYSIKSTNAPMVASENPFRKTESSAKEKVLISASVSESMSPLAERSQLETLENSGKAPFENLASKQEEEVMSRLTSNRKASGQGNQGDVHESGQLEHAASLASSSKTPLLRGGRKPLGFLSLICKKSSSESAEDTKGNRGKIQKPRIVTPKRSLKKLTPSTKGDAESCSLSSTSTSSVEYKNVAADAAVMVPSNEPSEKPPLCAKDQEKEEEPTRISEYFFSDIFMEVDDSE